MNLLRALARMLFIGLVMTIAAAGLMILSIPETAAIQSTPAVLRVAGVIGVISFILAVFEEIRKVKR